MKAAMSKYLSALYTQGAFSYSHVYLHDATKAFGTEKVYRFLDLYFYLARGKETELRSKWGPR